MQGKFTHEWVYLVQHDHLWSLAVTWQRWRLHHFTCYLQTSWLCLPHNRTYCWS